MLTRALVADMVNRAEAKASALGVACSIAVVDEGGNLRAFVRTDDATLGSIPGARRKAFTAAASGRSTAAFFAMVSENPAMASILGSGIEGFMFLPGGEPLRVGERHVGGIGVAGGQGSQDQEIADAGLEALA